MNLFLGKGNVVIFHFCPNNLFSRLNDVWREDDEASLKLQVFPSWEGKAKRLQRRRNFWEEYRVELLKKVSGSITFEREYQVELLLKSIGLNCFCEENRVDT